MPIWTCPRCGHKIENFGWGKPPWKSHSCAASGEAAAAPPASVAPAPVAPNQDIIAAPSAKEQDNNIQPNQTGLFQKAKKSNLSDFI